MTPQDVAHDRAILQDIFDKADTLANGATLLGVHAKGNVVAVHLVCFVTALVDATHEHLILGAGAAVGLAEDHFVSRAIKGS